MTRLALRHLLAPLAQRGYEGRLEAADPFVRNEVTQEAKRMLRQGVLTEEEYAQALKTIREASS